MPEPAGSSLEFSIECVCGLELHVFGRHSGAEQAVVLVTHGRGGHLANTHGLCRELAQRGLVAIGVEQRNHGRRLVSRAANEHTAQHAADLYGTIVGTAHDLCLLLDFLPARLGLSTARVGLTGVSLGGHVTVMALGLEARFTAAAALIGSGDYSALMHFRHQRAEFQGQSFEEFFSPALQSVVRRFDPIHRPEVFADRPLLLLNGEEDQMVPLSCNQGFEKALRPYFRQKERLELRAYAEVGHTVTKEMQTNAVDWLEHWLR